MFRYRIDVMKELAEMGYNTARLRHEKLLAQKTMTDIRAGVVVGINALDTLCRLLDLQPGQIIRWYPDDDAKDEQGDKA